MNNARRVAFFTDSFHEVNGLALTSRQFESFARRRQLPFFSVHAGITHKVNREGPLTVYEVQRSGAAFNLEATSDLAFDPLIWRQRHEILGALRMFQPDLLHVTGPSDIGMVGAWLAHKMRIPLAASWHTNVHEYASRRLEKFLSFLPEKQLLNLSAAAERNAFRGAARFYALARVLFAPNEELIKLLKERTGKPCFLMQRGVDAIMFTPAKRDPGDRPFTIGYVGRLSVEKNVRFLCQVENALRASGISNYRFLIAGSGGEQEWLSTNLQTAEMLGVVKGESLARAYANMDVFAFPSHTDSFGNVILEALASGVPVVVTTGGGPKYLVKPGLTGFVASDDAAFTRHIVNLAKNPAMHEQMREEARRYACSTSWERVFEGVYDAYEQVLFQGSSARAAT
jgi:glycosyltransferase involved in cell wall biosynthesis